MMHFLQQATFHKILRRMVEMCIIFATAFFYFFILPTLKKIRKTGGAVLFRHKTLEYL